MIVSLHLHPNIFTLLQPQNDLIKKKKKKKKKKRKDFEKRKNGRKKNKKWLGFSKLNGEGKRKERKKV